jgi:hypothetical protein
MGDLRQMRPYESTHGPARPKFQAQGSCGMIQSYINTYKHLNACLKSQEIARQMNTWNPNCHGLPVRAITLLLMIAGGKPRLKHAFPWQSNPVNVFHAPKKGIFHCHVWLPEGIIFVEQRIRKTIYVSSFFKHRPLQNDFSHAVHSDCLKDSPGTHLP